MADLETRREARLRKILQNSENRMNRLLGKPVVADEAPVQTSPISTDVPAENAFPERQRNVSEGSATNTDRQIPPVTNETHHTAAGDTNYPSDPEESHDLTEGVRHRSHRTVPTETEGEADQCVQDLSPGPADKPAITTQNGLVDSHAKTESAPEHMDPLRLLDLMRCGGCLLAAFLTRWALSFGLGLLFLECALIPFIVMEGSLLYFQTTHMKDLQLPHKTSMIMYALMLSGLKQELVVKYNTVMGYVSAATEDFALFLFAFLVCNAVM